MAKKTVTTTEEVDEIKTPEVKETPDESVKEEPKETPPPIDTAALKEELAAELLPQATEQAKQALIDTLSGPKEQNAYEKFVAEYQKDNGRTPNYAEALQFVKGQAKDEILAELKKEVDDEDEKAKTEKEQLEAAQKVQSDQLNTLWTQQLSDLEQAGKIPPITNKDDKEDPGVKTRVALFESLNKKIEDDQKAGRVPNYSLKEIFYEDFTSPTAQPPGANAPIAGINRGASPTNSDTFSYKDIHGKTASDILYEKLNK